MNTIFKSNKGFSLIELVIAVGISAIIASIAIPRYTKMTTKARRGECTGMLSSLKTIQGNYISEFGFSFNKIFCPKDQGLHAVTIGTAIRNVITAPRSLKDQYCSTALDTDGFPVPFNGEGGDVQSPTTYNYTYVFLALQWNEPTMPPATISPSNLLPGDSFPSFPEGTSENKEGYSNPGNWEGEFPIGGELISTDNNARRFQVLCYGNVDDDPTIDTVIMDHLSNTFVNTDDVKN